MHTLPMGALGFVGERVTDRGGLIAISILMFTPVFFIFFLIICSSSPD